MKAIGGSRFLAGLLALASSAALAQDPQSITGHVSAGGQPVQGASVRIRELGIGTNTNADGRFTFIVRSSLVRGQSVTLEARHVRYNPASVAIVLTGGTLSHDFELFPVGDSRASATAPTTAPATTQPGPVASAAAVRPTLDSTAFDELSGPTDWLSALAGRIVGLDVTGAGTLGGSAPAVLRGYHSIVNVAPPLVVVDGIPLDRSNFVMPGQPFGNGGFDYGSSLQDIEPAEIASVQFLRGPAAAAYGGRGANGVLLVTTRSGRGLSGFEVSAAQNATSESPLRLPSFQNAYGQGLGGKFSFFNGTGGGTNDSVAQNWGPALQGQPITQASLTVPKFGDVRPWLGRPDNVSGFFNSGTTLTTTASAQQAGVAGNYRLSIDRRDSHGVVPGNTFTRQGAALVGDDQLTSALSLTGHVQVNNELGRNRPATGDDPSNTIAALAQTGRQVDLTALKQHAADRDDTQISWNYAGFNNPYFALQDNRNRDERTHWIAGGSATYGLSSAVSATARVGTDAYNQSRNFDIAPTWMGGFPFISGRGDFTQGGFERQKINASETNADLLFSGRFSTGAAPSAGRLGLSGGLSHRANNFEATTSGSDQRPDTGTAPVPTPTKVTADNTTTAAFVTGQWQVNGYTTFAATARNEWYSVLTSGSNSAFYPSVTGSIDLARAGGMHGERLNAAVLHAGWSRSGGEVNPLLLHNVFVPAADSTATISASANLSPEITSAFELGATFSFFRNRAGLDLTFYDEQTSGVILGLASAGGSSIVATNVGTLSNKGLELQGSLVPVRTSAGTDWTIEAHVAKNSNSLDELTNGATAVALGPSVDGITVQARKGSALGALVGSGFKRDASGALLLQNGVPISDGQQHVLGTMAPDWTGGISSTFHIRWLDISALVDGRMGGSLFSTTNFVGMTSGTFQETAARPDSGQVFSGIDAATGKANSIRATTEAYYHALGAIQEAWVYSASFVKLRDARISFSVPLRGYAPFAAQSVRVSLIGRNLAMWSKAPNIDPETALSTTSFQGVELGQLPTVRSLGLQFSLTP
jgi:TonB-dependent SusC/RagA subfamily outer membrane receptor